MCQVILEFREVNQVIGEWLQVIEWKWFYVLTQLNCLSLAEQLACERVSVSKFFLVLQQYR